MYSISIKHIDRNSKLNFMHAADITLKKKSKKLSLCNDQGLSAVLSTWECYVVDFLTESFDMLIQFSANKATVLSLLHLAAV